MLRRVSDQLSVIIDSLVEVKITLIKVGWVSLFSTQQHLDACGYSPFQINEPQEKSDNSVGTLHARSLKYIQMKTAVMLG